MRWWKVGSYTVAMVALATLASGAALLYTAWGRERIRLEANRRVSEYIAGSLEIAHIDEISLPRIETRGVTISDPWGKPAIDVDHVTLELDFDAILDGRLAWHRADIRGGRVHVYEDDQGRINMEETFREASPSPSDPKSEAEQGPLDLRNMATSGIDLRIDGGSMPDLLLTDLVGIMRVHVLPSGETELPFSDYEGHIVEGLPTGRLDFKHLDGRVQTAGKRLLRFEGEGRSEGADCTFVLDIFTEPETKVEIDARFPELSAESLATKGFAAWTTFLPGMDLDLRHGPADDDGDEAP